MAMLKDSLITGDLRVTGTIYGNATSATALKDKTNNTLTYSNYGAAGLAGSSISWMTCWNGYELRAISKAETFNLVRDNGGNSTWVNISGDTMTGALNFANNTYNKMGDDAQIGDANQAGRIAIKGINGATGIYFAPYSGSTAQSFTIDGAGTATLTGSLSTTNLTLTNTTDATSSTAAGMKTAGGLAVAKKIWLGNGLGASSTDNNSSHLIISSSDTGAGGNVALELWRGTNASWQISNENGNLHFRTNYTTAKQTTYSVDAINIAYNSGNTIIKGTVTAPTFIGALTGNASTATTLQTSRTINGTNFNGSANITTANWGTARNISIADSDGTNTGTAVSVNGSANATLKLPATIKATLTGHASLDLPLAGGTMTGQIKSTKAGGSWILGRNNACLYQTLTTSNNWHPVVGFKTPSGSWTIGNVGDNENCVFSYDTDTNFNANTNTTMQALYFDSNGYIHANRVYNAVWNDYAEYRNYNDGETPYGKVVCENGDDSVSLSTKRLQPGAMICSDTFGTSMGEAENTIPIAVAGRVLAYPLEPREEFGFFIGQAVCAGPNGTVSIMTKDEVKEYPEAVVGYVSAVPQYEEWGTGKVKVDGRVWIKVK